MQCYAPPRGQAVTKGDFIQVHISPDLVSKCEGIGDLKDKRILSHNFRVLHAEIYIVKTYHTLLWISYPIEFQLHGKTYQHVLGRHPTGTLLVLGKFWRLRETMGSCWYLLAVLATIGSRHKLRNPWAGDPPEIGCQHFVNWTHIYDVSLHTRIYQDGVRPK